MVATFSPKNKDKNKLAPVRDRSNMFTVDSASAIERGTPLTFLLIAPSPKMILTKISPMRVYVSVRTLKSNDFFSKIIDEIPWLSIVSFSSEVKRLMLFYIEGIILFILS
jgi:hypothetical protein